MNFVCDECADSASFTASCNARLAGTVHRYPNAQKGMQDEDMLPIMLSKDRTLLTCDIQIAEDHPDSIPHVNSGIIIIRLRRPVRPMTHRLMANLIEKFKQAYPNWRHLDFRNIHFEICEDCIITTSLPLGSQRLVINYGPSFIEAIDAALLVARTLPTPS